MLASSYPLLDLFLTMLEIFLFILWIWLLIAVFGDIFRSHDMGGGAKAVWVIFVIIFPFLGVLVYLAVAACTNGPPRRPSSNRMHSTPT
jgi:predicted membrane channel-forming protein YqfA (hemolysin III family)